MPKDAPSPNSESWTIDIDPLPEDVFGLVNKDFNLANVNKEVNKTEGIDRCFITAMSSKDLVSKVNQHKFWDAPGNEYSRRIYFNVYCSDGVLVNVGVGHVNASSKDWLSKNSATTENINGITISKYQTTSPIESWPPMSKAMIQKALELRSRIFEVDKAKAS